MLQNGKWLQICMGGENCIRLLPRKYVTGLARPPACAKNLWGLCRIIIQIRNMQVQIEFLPRKYVSGIDLTRQCQNIGCLANVWMQKLVSSGFIHEIVSRWLLIWSTRRNLRRTIQKQSHGMLQVLMEKKISRSKWQKMF